MILFTSKKAAQALPANRVSRGKRLLLLAACTLGIVQGAVAQSPSVKWISRPAEALYAQARQVYADEDGNTYSIVILADSFRLNNIDFHQEGSYSAIVKRRADGQADWAKFVLDTSPSNRVYGVAALPDGGCYVAGTFSGTKDLFGTQLTSSGPTDGYLARLDAAGQCLWLKAIGGPGIDNITALAVSKSESGNSEVFVSGSFKGTHTFADPLQATAAGTGDNLFLAKIKSNGTASWLKTVGTGANYDRPEALIANNDHGATLTGMLHGNVVLAGQSFSSTSGAFFLVDFDSLGSERHAIHHAGETELFAYMPSGKMAVIANNQPGKTATISARNWAGQADWSYELKGAEGGDIKMDQAGNIYITGWYQQPLYWKGQLLHLSEGMNAYVVKLDSLGNLLWSTVTNHPPFTHIGFINSVPSGNGVNLHLDFQGPSLSLGYHTVSNVGPGNQSSFLARLEPSLGLVNAPAKNKAAFTCHPNPTSGVLQIARESAVGGPAEFIVCDAAGRIVQRVQMAGQETTTTVNLSAQASGIYFLKEAGSNNASVTIEKQ